MRLSAIPLALILLLLFALPAIAEPVTDAAEAEEGVSAEEIEAEIQRQADELDLEAWQSYCGDLRSIGIETKSIRSLIVRYAETGANSPPGGIWQVILNALKRGFSDCLGLIGALAAAAMLTAAAGILPKGGVRSAAEMTLCVLSVLVTASLFSSLFVKALQCVKKISELTQTVLPVMTALLSASGAVSSAGVFRPLMLFLSGTLIAFINGAIIPLILAGGVIGILESICGIERLGALFRLIKKAVVWLMGITAVTYFGVCAFQGLTVSAADGVAVRTARYAVDKLLPSTGGFIGGSAEVFMSCAGLVKNGAGAASVITLLALEIKPLISIGAGSFVFRTASAVASPVADKKTVRMLENAAEMTGLLFGAAAVVSFMFVLTVLVFTAAGGVTARLW